MSGASEESRVARSAIGVGLLALLLAAMDSTVVGTILATMRKDLGGQDGSAWLISGFILAQTVAAPVFGRLADTRGIRSTFVWAILIFAAGSLWVAVAGTLAQAIAARTLQGVGAGGIPTLCYTIVASFSTPEQRPKRQGMVSGVWGVAAILGPLFGALAASTVGWRWVFLINLPVSAIILFLVRTRFPAVTPRAAHAGSRLDPLALGYLSGAITLGLLGLSTLSSELPRYLGLGAVAGCGFMVVLLRTRLRSTPSLPPLQGVAGPALWANLAAAIVLYGSITFVPQLLQNVMSQTVTMASSAVLAGSLGWVVGSIVSGNLLVAMGYRKLATLGALLMAAACVSLAWGALSGSLALVVVAQLVLGLGMGGVANTTLISVQNHVSDRHLGTMTALVQLSRSVGAAIGVSGLSVAIAAFAHAAPARAFSLSLLGLAPVALLAAVATVRLPRPFMDRTQTVATSGGGSLVPDAGG
jgi:MFS family permease